MTTHLIPISVAQAPVRRGLREIAILLVWLTLGVLVGFHPALRHGWRLPLENYPDTRLMTLVLENGHRCLSRDPSLECLWRQPIFHPFSSSGALTELQLGILPFYSVWRWAGVEPFGSALLAQLMQSIGVFALVALLLRRGLSATAWEAGFGALLVAFGSPKMAQVYHLQLYAQVPLFLVAWILQGLVTAAPRMPSRAYLRHLAIAFLIALLVVLQTYSCLYLVLLSALLLGASVPGLALFASERRTTSLGLRRNVLAWSFAILVAVALLWPLGSRYLAVSSAVARPSAESLSALLPTPAALLNPGRRSWLGGPLAEWTGVPDLPYSWEMSLGIGLLTTALVVAGVPAGLRTPWLRVLLVGTALAWLTILKWPGGFSLWQLIAERAPTLGFLRAPSRIQLLALPVLAACAILGLRQVRRRWGPVAVAVLCVIAIAEQIRDWGGQVPSDWPSPEQVARALPPDCGAFFLSTLGDPERPQSLHLTAAWVALDSGVPTLNGYSGYRPTGWRLGAAYEPDRGAGELRGRVLEWMEHSGLRDEVCWLRADPERLSFDVERLSDQSSRPNRAAPGGVVGGAIRPGRP